MLRQRQLPEARRHSASLVAVGLAAGLYHASAGAFRPLARKLDYWTIAWSASEMVGGPPGWRVCMRLSA